MNTLAEVAVDQEGKPIELNKWIVEEWEDEKTGEVTRERYMYTKPVSVPFCSSHSFNKAHECTKCPYIFTGFRGHMHIQKMDGIYERHSNKKVA